jgi:hypothetical protein
VTLYPWLVLIHLIGVIVFAVSHGVSIAMAFWIRGERDPSVVASHLRSSQKATLIMYAALAILVIGGLGAAWTGGLLLAPWVVASYIVLGIVLVTMWAVATPYYVRVRTALAPDPVTGRPTIAEPALAELLASRRPDVLSSVGGLGLLILVWLMVLKPG